MIRIRGLRAALALANATLASLNLAAAQNRQVEIPDLILKMRAYSMTVPAGWRFEGRIMPGTPCVAGPFPVFRLMSPDGLTGARMLPRLDWAWSDLPKNPNQRPPDCLQIDRQLAAAELLRYLVPILGVTFVRELPPEHLAELQANAKEANARAAATTHSDAFPPVQTIDQARFLVRYNVNAVPVDEYLRATVSCLDEPRRVAQNPAPNHFHSCSAVITRTRAREGQLDALQATMTPVSQSFTVDSEWNRKWLALSIDKINAASAQDPKLLAPLGPDAARARQALRDALAQGQELRRQQNAQLLAAMQPGAHPSPSRDWVDYALELNLRLNPATGALPNARQ